MRKEVLCEFHHVELSSTEFHSAQARQMELDLELEFQASQVCWKMSQGNPTKSRRWKFMGFYRDLPWTSFLRVFSQRDLGVYGSGLHFAKLLILHIFRLADARSE
jgi:hypothetical protein